MTAISAPGGDVVVYRSPDRLIRVGLTVCAAAVAAGPLVVLVLVRPSVTTLLLLVALVLAAVGLCHRIAGEYCVVSESGIVDRRTFRCVSCTWTDVAAVAVDHPGGPWGGLCVQVHLRRGLLIALLGTRRYTYSAASEGMHALTSAHATIEQRVARVP